ncbi:hypothetical protein FOA52_009354, partial [Chlamydomonas sp. UWO 241]
EASAEGGGMIGTGTLMSTGSASALQPLLEARDVLRAVRTVATRARGELMAVQAGAEDEGVRWVTASRSQPTDEAADLVAGMSDTEQELACLHADAVSALFRVELKVGCCEQQARALAKQSVVVEGLAKRDSQAAVFGTRTMKERRLDDSKLDSIASVSTNPPLKERELLAAVGRNPYERALLLVQMAPFQSEQHKQNAMLTEAAECLVRAQAAEDGLLAQARPDVRPRTAVPLQPKILQRGPTSCTFTHFPFALKGAKRAARYCIFAKNFGAGVGLTVNKAAMEFPGTGIQVPLDTPITVEGLGTNDTYIFAAAAYDEAGQIIGGLGTASREVLAALPLPLYMCWAHLLLVATKNGLKLHAQRAAGVLLPHFIDTSPDRPLWEANPQDAQALHRGHMGAACRPLLRTFVQAALAWAPVALQAALAWAPVALQAEPGIERGPRASAVSGVGPEYRDAYLAGQVARLKAVQTTLLAMEVAAMLRDEMLVQEGALRAHNMLAPLLALQPVPQHVHKALAKVHLSLQGIANMVQDSLVGQEASRAAAARAAAAASYYLVTLSTEAGEGGSAQYFGRLEMELLRAYDPKFSIPGRPQAEKLQPEAKALQDGLLMHPRLQELGAGVLAERAKDAGDLAAKVLPLLSGSSPLSAWEAALGKEEATRDPRWVELVVRMLESAVRAGVTTSVTPIAVQVAWHCRAAQQRPRTNFEPWSLADAAAAVPDDAAMQALVPREGPGDATQYLHGK